jgi:HEAT repeat protein
MNRPPPPAKAFGVPVPYKATITQLREQLSQPGPKAWAACLALGHNASQEAFDLLVELTGRDWNYRNLAIQSLGIHPLGAGAAEVIVKGLSDPIALVVRTACDACANLKLTAARNRLIKLLENSDPQIRFHALRALGAVWTGEEYGRVWHISKKDPAVFVRREAAVVLKETASEKTWHALFDRWKHDPLPLHRVWACQLLSAFGKSSDMPELQRLVRDGNVHVRRAAEQAAVERGVA